ncbi:MAG TPA: molybdate ABC transporter substrate-binding protein [Bacillales bacterium]|nr:molybdate ABC transporter substrate-binding protein [Bacillales bacterium]
MKGFIVFLGLVFILAGCGGSGSAQSGNGGGKKPFAGEDLTVFAAAHFTEAFKDLKQAFEKKTGADVTISFAGTQTLRTQIEHGANPDVFASANLHHMKAVKKEGYVNQYKVCDYNSLIVIIPKKNPAGLKNFKDLDQKQYKLVIGVKNVPIGSYTRKVLENANQKYGEGFKKKVMANVVSFEPNVKKVASKVTLGAADAGFVYPTALTPSVAKKVKTIKIPDGLNVKATDTIAVLKNSKHPKLAKKWVQFVLSDKGQHILAKHHLIPLDQKKQ